jgi:hypothetical protein
MRMMEGVAYGTLTQASTWPVLYVLAVSSSKTFATESLAPLGTAPAAAPAQRRWI